MIPAARFTPFRLTISIALLAAFSMPASLTFASTLDTIRSRGAIVLGHRESSVPFSYVDASGQVQGYSHELAIRIVDSVRRHLGEPKLEMRLQPVTPMNRIAKIRSGEIDLECGSTTHNSLRARQAGFSNTIFIIGTRLLAGTRSGIHDFADLSGRKVVTTAGTTSERLLRQLNDEQLLGVEVLTSLDHRESFLRLERGEADAFMMDDALLYGERAAAKEPGNWVVTGTPRSFEAYACMMKLGDPDFKRLVDNTLASIMTSGEAERIYNRWFVSPLPDSGLNLNFPLSDAMRSLFRAPNDRPFQ